MGADLVTAVTNFACVFCERFFTIFLGDAGQVDSKIKRQ